MRNDLLYVFYINFTPIYINLHQFYTNLHQFTSILHRFTSIYINLHSILHQFTSILPQFYFLHQFCKNLRPQIALRAYRENNISMSRTKFWGNDAKTRDLRMKIG